MKICAARIAGLLTVCGLLSSCKTDVNKVDAALNFKAPANGEQVWNSVTLELNASNTKSISKAEFFANDQLIGTVQQAPYRMEWNTLTFEDKDYEVKAVVTAVDGAQTSATLGVTVRNTLLSFSVPPNHLQSYSGIPERGWVFISSGKGELIAMTEFHNGEKLTLVNNGCNDKTFLLSEAYMIANASLEISSFQNINRGHWTLGALGDNPPVLGKLAVSFRDSVGVHPYYISASGDSQVFFEGGNSIKLNLTQSPTRLFIREISNGTNHYDLVEGLSLNTSYTGAFADLKNPLMTITTPTVAGAGTAGVRLYGFPKANGFEEFYELGVFYLNQGTVTIEYPGTSFAAYGSENVFRSDNFRMNTFHPSKMFDLTLLKAQVIFKDLGGNSATVATFGDFDTYVVAWGYVDRESSFSWTISGAAGGSEMLTLPLLPGEIRSAGLKQFDVKGLLFQDVVQIADYEIATDYKSYIQFLTDNGYNAPYQFGKAWKEQAFFTNGVTGGGRQRSQEIPTIKERLKRG